MHPDIFWPAVLQVIPVLALALVLEMRAVGNRYRRKRTFKGTSGERALAVVPLFLAAILLTASFLITLYALYGLSVARWHVVVVGTSLTVAFMALVLQPAGMLFAAISQDAWMLVWRRRVPFSRVRRRYRAMNQFSKEVGDLRVKWARERLRILGVLAESYVNIYQDSRRGGRSSGTDASLDMLDRALAEFQDTSNEAAKRLNSLSEKIEAIRALPDVSESEIEAIRRSMRLVL